ncbi:kunitz-type trypsin inhibitor alpha chain-like [Prosopis cineraria]|uniref:kunitz-type trypsin inhibitor alpha chain-like n=1 Tax=Prosopis cineraria TaxID=364024 RepID=UPI0024101C8C|nr:kunitz-type trypsin inhibitor alpha chain-like [Prosopis cineraria]
MKPDARLALSFSFFFVALFAFTRAEYIYDSDGDIVNNGGNYYLLPPSGHSGLATATINRGHTLSCLLAVALGFDQGYAAKIATPYPLKFITNDYPLNISFADLPSNACTDSPSWTVADIYGNDEDSVMVGNPQEFFIPRSGNFYIKKYDSESYKLAFCYSTSSCGYVTTRIDGLLRTIRLIVTQDRSVQPFVFKLVKATSNDVASGISMVV